MDKQEKKYSIEEIAKLSGVSKATVSRVINNNPHGVSEKTKKRVQQVIDNLNYRPNVLARSIALNKSNMIGLIVPDVANFFYPTIIRSVTDYMSSKNYSVLLANSDYEPEKEASELLGMIDKRVDGIILCSGVSNSLFLRKFREYKIPIALLGRTFDSSLSDVSISGNNEIGGYKSAKFLLDGGNRKIVYIEGNPGISGSQQRLRGYKRALNESGITIDPALIINGEYSITFGKKTVDGLLLGVQHRGNGFVARLSRDAGGVAAEADVGVQHRAGARAVGQNRPVRADGSGIGAAWAENEAYVTAGAQHRIGQGALDLYLLFALQGEKRHAVFRADQQTVVKAGVDVIRAALKVNAAVTVLVPQTHVAEEAHHAIRVDQPG